MSHSIGSVILSMNINAARMATACSFILSYRLFKIFAWCVSGFIYKFSE